MQYVKNNLCKNAHAIKILVLSSTFVFRLVFWSIYELKNYFSTQIQIGYSFSITRLHSVPFAWVAAGCGGDARDVHIHSSPLPLPCVINFGSFAFVEYFFMWLHSVPSALMMADPEDVRERINHHFRLISNVDGKTTYEGTHALYSMHTHTTLTPTCTRPPPPPPPPPPHPLPPDLTHELGTLVSFPLFFSALFPLGIQDHLSDWVQLYSRDPNIYLCHFVAFDEKSCRDANYIPKKYPR